MLALKLKLALVSPYDFAYPGGVTEHVAHLAEQFIARGHEVHIVAPSSDDESEPTASVDAPVHRIGRVVSIPANGSVARITLSLRSYLQAKELLQAEQFDLIHLHEPMMPALPLTVLRHSNTTNIGTFHAFRNTPLTYFYGKPILRPFFRKLHGHITVSGPARDFVGEYFPADYRVIPNGIDFPRFFALRAVTAVRRLASDGALRRTPGEAQRPEVPAARVAARYWSGTLTRAWSWLVVAGRWRATVASRRARGGLRRTSCSRATSRPRTWRATTSRVTSSVRRTPARRASASCCWRRWQRARRSWPSDIPGYREVVTHGLEGLLVEPKNPGAIADGVARLLANPELRASMRRAGQAKAQAYDWPRVASQVLDYYAEVLERRETEPVPQRVRFARVRRMAGMLARM